MIGHVETPTPMNVFGAKGMGDGSSMLTPAAIANAVADALGRDDIMLPLDLAAGVGAGQRQGTSPPAKVCGAGRYSQPKHQPAKARYAAAATVLLSAPVAEVWRRLTDPNELAAIVPGCREPRAGRSGQLRRRGRDRRRRHPRRLHARDRAARQETSRAQCGWSARRRARSDTVPAQAWSRCAPRPTVPHAPALRLRADVGGKVAAVGQRMLGTVTRYLIAQFFPALERRLAPQARRRLARAGCRMLWGAAAEASHEARRLRISSARTRIIEAVVLLTEMREEAAVLAGGMTLGPMLNMRLVRPRAVDRHLAHRRR